MTEIDPLWSNDLLTFVLNPGSVVFANPLALAWCMADCVATTLRVESESNPLFCAGCDGLIYPHTGNIHGITDPVQNSSLLLQRQLAPSSPGGFAEKDHGEEDVRHHLQLTSSRSQYRVDALPDVPGSARSRPLFDPRKQSWVVPAAQPALCPLTTAATGSVSPCISGRRSGQTITTGRENYVYLIWRYVDCCVPQCKVCNERNDMKVGSALGGSWDKAYFLKLCCSPISRFCVFTPPSYLLGLASPHARAGTGSQSNAIYGNLKGKYQLDTRQRCVAPGW